ncbi:hypothetical protein ACIG3E_23870 [Streptomyces sp. NPDC053474]
MKPQFEAIDAWARAQDMDVPLRGRLRAEIWDVWHAAHPTPGEHTTAPSR